MENIGGKITSIREANNISQSALARDLDVSRSALYRYEIGERMPDMNFLIAFAKKFSIGLDDLVFGNNYIPPETSTKKATPEEIENGLNDIWETLHLDNASDKQLELISKVIKDILETDF